MLILIYKSWSSLVIKRTTCFHILQRCYFFLFSLSDPILIRTNFSRLTIRRWVNSSLQIKLSQMASLSIDLCPSVVWHATMRWGLNNPPSSSWTTRSFQFCLLPTFFVELTHNIFDRQALSRLALIHAKKELLDQIDLNQIEPDSMALELQFKT